MHKRFISWFLFCLLIAGLVGCSDASPAGVATLAPTAAIPEQLPEAEAQPVTAPTSVPTAVASATPAAPTPTLAPTDTPTPTATPTPVGPTLYSYRVLNTFPHDPEAFTQGLVIDGVTMYEGTGRWGESSLREVVLETGAVVRNLPLDAQYFGEGIAVFGDKIYQLTWQEQTGFVYDKNTFELLQTFSYPHEGWGITDDGQRLIVSDGTATIRFWDPNTLQETGQILVQDVDGPVNRLNELEYINGEIWANVWLTDLIARIDPETGRVVGWVDLAGILDPDTLTQPVDVLNGVAFDEANNRLFVTGKLWPALFEIEVIPAQP
jgi:glutamine cyclotransferase